MKLVKTIGNFAQLCLSVYLAYNLYLLIYPIIQLGGLAVIPDLIMSNVGIMCAITLSLISCGLVGMSSFSEGKVKSCAFMSLVTVLGYCILCNFVFDTYSLIAVCVLGMLNLCTLLGYVERT